MSREERCLIWGTAAEIADPDGREGTHVVSSARAGGEYFISGTADAVLRRRDEPTKARLTSWLVEQRLLGVRCPEIMDNTLDDVERRRPLTVQRRADRLLRCFSEKSPVIGDVVHFIPKFEPPNDTHMEMLAWSESLSAGELLFLIRYLSERGWIAENDSNPDDIMVFVTVDGFGRLADLEKEEVDSKQAFVAMWFDESMEVAYEKGIEPAIREAGYEPMRIDRKEHINKIDDEIIAEIRRSRFLVADFTQGESGARGGVYYEAGFAHGLNIPVIFTCQEDAIGEVHLDTRQYNHITWKSPEELQVRLAQRISATIGDGPLKHPG